VVGVDLQPHLLIAEAELVEELGISLGREHVQRDGVGRWVVEPFVCELSSHQVRDVVSICGYLNGKLPSTPEGSRPPGKDGRMVRHPLHRCVGKHDVEGLCPLPLTDVTDLESDPVRRLGRRCGDHRRRTFDPECGGGTDRIAQGNRQSPVTATHIDDHGRLDMFEQSRQIPERLLPLGCESVVLSRVPSIEGRHPRSSMTPGLR
jgi:hypothetical protein